ncbi:MAG TPA: pyridoxamine 5'-phosphate oxidase family protein [Acidimicrobiales bacterium]|nr:pyridoxamine 5'-phosphate oxidase family protein [Acidimicrobiales bacterium]
MSRDPVRAGSVSDERGVVASPLTNDGREGLVLAWTQAEERLAAQRYYWLATTGRAGQPQVRPVLAVWIGTAICTTSSPVARKARNLQISPSCSIVADAGELHLVLEGVAEQLTDPPRLEIVAAAYREKYDWPVEIDDGMFQAPYGAPTAGPPPYGVIQIVPTAVFGFVAGGNFGPASTRWSFV